MKQRKPGYSELLLPALCEQEGQGAGRLHVELLGLETEWLVGSLIKVKRKDVGDPRGLRPAPESFLSSVTFSYCSPLDGHCPQLTSEHQLVAELRMAPPLQKRHLPSALLWRERRLFRISLPRFPAEALLWEGSWKPGVTWGAEARGAVAAQMEQPRVGEGQQAPCPAPARLEGEWFVD